MDSDHDYEDQDNTSDEAFDCPLGDCPKNLKGKAGKCNYGYCVVWYWEQEKRKKDGDG